MGVEKIMFEEQVYEIVKKIPRARVATYGQIADFAGNKQLARAVENGGKVSRKDY